ncbi:MAG: hypothetical protein CM15mP102_06950 [Flavobacteriales bacterium]|nr:MAG: hypothetical protein CM15mP102_06950 [Flavobacteriales bacterium]
MSGIIDFLILEALVLIKLKISDLLISSEINDDSLLISNITLLMFHQDIKFIFGLNVKFIN